MGGVGAGGGASPLVARVGARHTHFPGDRPGIPVTRENWGWGPVGGEERAVPGSRDRQCSSPIIEQEEEEEEKMVVVVGGERMRLPNESKAVGCPREPADSSVHWLLQRALSTGVVGGKARQNV